MSDSRNRRSLNTSPSVDARVSELFRVLDAAEEMSTFYYNSVCKACSQKVEKLLKFENSVNSILSTLKASIQALLL